jgi:2-dehydropantoate 2-reductase
MNVLATQRGHRHYPSMLEDVEARRPTELELINGALVREARRRGVPAPLQTALYRLVKAKEASYAAETADALSARGEASSRSPERGET